MTPAPQGFLNLVLHAHLPYVRHPEYPDFLEEDWFYEAITETYVPLLDMMERLAGENVEEKRRRHRLPLRLSGFSLKPGSFPSPDQTRIENLEEGRRAVEGGDESRSAP